MEIFIDNKNLKDYGIQCLDYSGALSFAAERENSRVWSDKSGVDKNLANIRYDSKEFILKLIVKASNEVEAHNYVKNLVSDMFTRGCFVLSLRDSVRNIRECFICERSDTIIGDITIRSQNSLYYFKLGLRDINPNAVKYHNTISSGESEVLYDKGQSAVIYWGNGDRSEVSNSGLYEKTDYAEDGAVDVIIDIDQDAPTITSLVADFSADSVSGAKQMDVQFTDESLGDVVIWSWNFGDGVTSDLENPSHTYEEVGTYTVSLQVFNAAQGADVEIKTNYITVRHSVMLVNASGDRALINIGGDKGLIN